MTTAALKQRLESLKATALGTEYVTHSAPGKALGLKISGALSVVMYEVTPGNYFECLAEFFDDADGKSCGARFTPADGEQIVLEPLGYYVDKSQCRNDGGSIIVTELTFHGLHRGGFFPTVSAVIRCGSAQLRHELAEKMRASKPYSIHEIGAAYPPTERPPMPALLEVGVSHEN